MEQWQVPFALYQHCEAVMKRLYWGAQSEKLAVVIDEEVKVYSNDPTGLHVKFDKIPTHVSVFLAPLASCIHDQTVDVP